MHRIDTSTATSDGLFTEGDPLVPTPATVVSADWLNSVQEELATIVTNAGLELQKADNTQVLTAILQIIARQSSELERLRLLKIGCPMYWRSTTLPENFAWVNGDLIFFEDRPEFEEVYLAGGFEGMLLEANATSEQIAANLGKFRKHPNGLGLYLPSCGEQFFRAWGQGTGDAGGYNAPGLPNIQGVSSGDNGLTTHVLSIGPVWTGPMRVGYNLESAGEVYERRANPYEGLYGGMQFDASRANAIYGASPTVMPPSVNVPCITYLGLPA